MEGTNLCICGYLSTEIGNQKDKEDPFSTEWQLQIECGKKDIDRFQNLFSKF